MNSDQIEALLGVANILEKFPEHHNQSDYVKGMHSGSFRPLTIQVDEKEIHCGTSQCVAGWALAWQYGSIELTPFVPPSGYAEILLPNGDRVKDADVNVLARDILGLDPETARILFHCIRQDTVDWPKLLRLLASGVDIELAVTKCLLDPEDEDLDILTEIY